MQLTYSQYIKEAADKINRREVEFLITPSLTKIIDKLKLAVMSGTANKALYDKLASDFTIGQSFRNAQNADSRFDVAADSLDLDLIDKRVIYYTNPEPRIEDWAKQEQPIIVDYESAKLKTRRERKEQARQRAILALSSGAIGGKFGGFKRATMWQINDQAKKNRDAERFLNTHIAIGRGGEKISLSNSFQRKMAEFAIVGQGIQKVAELEGMAWAKIVVTLPPEFHINPSVGKNNWNGMLPDKSCKILHKQWGRLRSALAKETIKLAGLWTRETHADGTPHINFLIYLPQGSENQVEQKFKEYMALGNTSAKAIKFVTMQNKMYDGACGFAKYAAKGFEKYAAKNLDTNNADNIDGLGEQSLATAFGWRRWGFFGIPPLSQWRALRSQKDNPNATPLLNSLWRAARGNDFATFIQLNGGLCGKSRDRTISTFSEPSESGKSKIVVGVWEKSTSYYMRTKTIGYFELIAQEVTLNITYPSRFNDVLLN